MNFVALVKHIGHGYMIVRMTGWTRPEELLTVWRWCIHDGRRYHIWHVSEVVDNVNIPVRVGIKPTDSCQMNIATGQNILVSNMTVNKKHLP